MFSPSLLKSFHMGGFECSTHRRRDGRRLDLLAATGHDRAAEADYRRLAAMGIRTMRDGLRWHLIEKSPGQYDWSSFLPMLRAARKARVQVIWDLCHYGWPDDIDIWTPAFVDRFARFAGAAARLVREESDEVPFYCPVNEISFWAWAGGDEAIFNPMARGRGGELKAQLVRASIAAIEAVWQVDPRARIVHAEPLINIVADPARPEDRDHANERRLWQYGAWDMLAGRFCPELGGKPDYLGLLGVNYYSNNQWILNGPTVELGDPLYRPLRDMLAETYERYGRPMLIAETGAEGDFRPAWFRYVASEARAAMAAGVPLEGLCMYPVLHYPGWENERQCETGLLGNLDQHGSRDVYAPLMSEVMRQQRLDEEFFDLGSNSAPLRVAS